MLTGADLGARAGTPMTDRVRPLQGPQSRAGVDRHQTCIAKSSLDLNFTGAALTPARTAVPPGIVKDRRYITRPITPDPTTMTAPISMNTAGTIQCP
jgi:hypothetical protein